MKSSELREKTNSELTKELHASEERLGKLYFELAAGRAKNVKEVSLIRRKIARIKTIIREQDKT